MTQQEIEAKLVAIQTYLQGQSDIITFHEQRIKELEVQVSKFKVLSGGGQSTALLTGVESQTITYNLGEVYEVLFYNDIAYTARIQLKSTTVDTVKYLQIYKDGQLISNLPSGLPVQVKINANAIQLIASNRVTNTVQLATHVGNAAFVKIQKK